MTMFSPLRTARLQVEMRELTAAEAILLCQLPASECESGAGQLLNRIVVPVSEQRRGQVTDVRLWSVQERALAIAHYLGHMLAGDFQIGETARYSDYLLAEGIGGPPAPVHLGEVDGRRWMLQPMLGWHSESVERLVVSEDLDANRNGWMIGAMAVQLYAEDDGALDAHDLTDAQIDAAVGARVTAMMHMPESKFMELFRLFGARMNEMDHVFRMSIGDDGIAWLPTSEVPGKPPARFPFSMAIREDTAEVFGPAV